MAQVECYWVKAEVSMAWRTGCDKSLIVLVGAKSPYAAQYTYCPRCGAAIVVERREKSSGRGEGQA